MDLKEGSGKSGGQGGKISDGIWRTQELWSKTDFVP